MENRPKPVMRRVHVEEVKAERTRVVTMSGVLEDGVRVWCEEHWQLPGDTALDKVLVHCAWWTTDRTRASSSFDAAVLANDAARKLAADVVLNHRYTQMDTDAEKGSAAANEPEARGSELVAHADEGSSAEPNPLP